MRIRRNESYRYELDDQPAGSFYLERNGKRSSAGKMKVFNISQSGLAILTSLQLPVEPDTKIFVSFSLDHAGDTFEFKGRIMHHKWIGQQHLYGLLLETTSSDQQRITEAVKRHAKERHERRKREANMML